MKRTLPILLAASLALTLCACGKKEDESNIKIPIRTGNTVNYDTQRARIGTILEQVTLEAAVGTPYTLDLSFTRMGGTIASINVHDDQEVQEGDVIAALDSTELEDEIVVQELTLNSARSTYENLTAQHADDDDIEFARIAYEIEQYKYDRLVEKRDYLELKAPFDGRIISLKDYWVGSHIDMNTPLCTISDSSKVCLTATDYMSQLSNVSFGTMVDVRQGALVSTTGKVVDTITSEYRDRETGGMIQVYTYVIQTDEEIESSELGGIEVIFTTLRRDDAVIVPTEAVFETTDETGASGHYVNVLMNGIKVQTSVSVGVISGDDTEIVSGLDGTETLIMP